MASEAVPRGRRYIENMIEEEGRVGFGVEDMIKVMETHLLKSTFLSAKPSFARRIVKGDKKKQRERAINLKK